MVKEAPTAQVKVNHTVRNYKKSGKGYSVSVMAKGSALKGRELPKL